MNRSIILTPLIMMRNAIDLFFKLLAAVSLSLLLGLGSAYIALWIVAKADGMDARSENPYARAAFMLRDFLPAASSTRKTG